MIDSWAPLDALATLVETLDPPGSIPPMQRVYRGVPNAPDRQIAAYVALGGFEHRRHTTGPTYRQYQNYLVTFMYQTSSVDLALAEQTVARCKDALLAVLQADLTLGGLLRDTTIDGSLANTPLYQAFAGQEWRLLPLMVTGLLPDT